MENEPHIRRQVPGFLPEEPLFDTNVQHHWKNYLGQSAMAALALLVILLIFDVLVRAAIIAAIASTAFIVFVMPHSRAATPRRVIGGHVVAVLVASAFSLLDFTPLGDLTTDVHIAADFIAVAAVGVSILVMVLTNTQHPPAASSALGLIIHGWDPASFLFILLGAALLAVAHRLLKSRMISLF